MTGQINMDSSFGKVLASTAANPLYKTFCEVGTWNGFGSTRCLYEGLKQNPGGQLLSLEGNREMHTYAASQWKNTPQVQLVYGTLHRNVMTPEEVTSHPLFLRIHEHYTLHYNSERSSCLNAPLVTVPPCDVILLDGGEFSTEGDWSALYHPNLKVVALDDTQIIKTNRIYNELKQSSEWETLYDAPTERNGWAVFRRI